MNSKLSYLNTNNVIRVITLLFIVIISSCKMHKEIGEAKCSISNKTAKALSHELKSNELNFNTLKAKMSVDSEVDSSYNSFTVNLKMHRDSLIWASISKMGVEGVRVLISTDSVWLLNRLDKTYFSGNFSYLSKLLNTSLDFNLIQSLLTGNSVDFYDDEDKIKSNVNDCLYVLGTIRKSKMKRVLHKGKELREPVQSIYLDPESYKILKILFFEFNPERNVTVSYSDFKLVDSIQQFPTKSEFEIIGSKKIKINIQYTRYKLNQPLTFSFRIPSTYKLYSNEQN